MRKKWQHYSEEECLGILRDYYSSGLTKGGCCRKYGIKSSSTLSNWLRKYEFHPELLSLQANQSKRIWPTVTRKVIRRKTLL